MMKTKLKDKHGLIGLNKNKLYRARERALGGSIHAHAAEYSKLRWYANMILRTNPGSRAVICSDLVNGQTSSQVVAHPIFKRIFISLFASKRGFIDACRPIVGLDGCHLKGPYGGILLTAIGLDGNLMFFPLAWAIVEQEDWET